MMPDDELTVMFRQSKDQRAQVKILAELNGVSTAVMAEKLTALGCQLPELPASWLRGVPPLKAKDPGFDMDRARALFAEGKSDLEIAEMLGCSVDKFARWRTQNGMKRACGAAAHKAPRKARKPQRSACQSKPPMPPEVETPEPVPAPETAGSGSQTTVAAVETRISAGRLGQTLVDLQKRYPGLTLTVNGAAVRSLCLNVRVTINGTEDMSSTLDLEVG